ncbi:MAG: hypothetical protein AB7F35_19185 [Acetobacteraceae bacterium]
MKAFLPLAVALIPLVGSLVPASAQINPFWAGRNDPRMSAEDNNLLLASIDRLNRRKNVDVGASDSWRNPQTGSHGTSSVTGIFQRSGMTCHRMRHEISTRGDSPEPYDLTWCLTPEGAWKIAG